MRSDRVKSPPASSAFTAFRNVSACNRCRIRKNRCDQLLPSCSSCDKVGVICVGYDPITKKEVPRSYVFYLESRVEYLEDLLRANAVPFKAADSIIVSRNAKNGEAKEAPTATGAESDSQGKVNPDQDGIDKLVTNASQVAVRGTSDSRYLGSASGISFARVVFAALKKSIKSNVAGGRSTPASELNLLTGSNASGTTMRESLFGLHTNPNMKPAPFPSRKLGERLVDLYFQHANPQFPILHRPEFMAMFSRVYENRERPPTARESYMLNIVFAIGSGIIVGKPADVEEQERQAETDNPEPPMKRRRLTEEQRQPEEYHASAIIHLEAVLNSSNPTTTDGPGGNLEELQAVLLLAAFALLRPVPPGLWYIIGVAVRLAVDLGLHADDGIESNAVKALGSKETKQEVSSSASPGEGFKSYISDWRRRLWWCVYSFDRLVCSVVGRPFGIPDQSHTTEFPSLVRDEFITSSGFQSPPDSTLLPTYKLISYHYFRLRLLHSEILQVLHHNQVQLARERGLIQENPYTNRDLPCPYLKQFDDNFLLWRDNMDTRLSEWNESAPTQEEAGVRFSPMFFELNYWQTVIMLYRQSLSVPQGLADDLKSVPQDVQSPVLSNLDDYENKDSVFIKVAQAGQKILKLYRQLHRKYLVNYTYLATHHLFIAGISFLYSIWYSPLVRSHLTLDDVDFTILAATSVLDDLIVFCPPARACRDAFSRMASTTIKMGIAKGGFGLQADAAPVNFDLGADEDSMPAAASKQKQNQQLDPNNPNFAYAPNSRKPSLQDPPFDPDLRALFSPHESAAGLVSSEALAQLRQHRAWQQPQPGQASSFDVAPAVSNTAFSTPPMTSANPPELGAFDFSPQQWGSDLDFWETVSVPEQVRTGNVDVPVDPLAMDMGMSMGYGGWDGSLAGLDWGDGSGSVDVFHGFFFGGAGPSGGANEGL